MLGFNLKRSSRDFVVHLILIAIPIALIAFFNFVYTNSDIISGIQGERLNLLATLTVGFALTFQIYGAGLSFETIGIDFFSPIHDRLACSPANLRSMIITTLVSSSVVSFAQTLAIMLFSVIVLGTGIVHMMWVLAIMLLSIIFHQLFGSAILLASRSVKTANIVTTIYGSIAPMLVGLYFPLPDTKLFAIIRQFSTPMSLANTAIRGIIIEDTGMLLSALAPLLVLIILLFLILKPLVGRVTR
ncbi:MAG: ABC transporter permease [Sphaerochaetaceae bacterium]|nr:ABC transporter permease [Sphaerochaetaceae bacterium]